MKRPLALVGTLAVTVGVLAGTLIAPAVGASSHREAPSISKDPSADNTDTYAFVSPDKPDTVTLVANYIPAEQPSGGPNFYSGIDVLYEIHVHNGNGDDERSLIPVPLQDQGRESGYVPVQRRADHLRRCHQKYLNWNRPQTYDVTRVDERGRSRRRSPTTCSSRRSTSARDRRRTTTSWPRRRSRILATVGRSLLANVTIRSSSTWAPSSTWLGLRPFNQLHAIPLADRTRAWTTCAA